MCAYSKADAGRWDPYCKYEVASSRYSTGLIQPSVSVPCEDGTKLRFCESSLKEVTRSAVDEVNAENERSVSGFKPFCHSSAKHTSCQ